MTLAPRQRIAERQSISIVNPNFSAPAVVELLAAAGFDAVFIDCEHGPHALADVENMRRAADAHGLLTFVRTELDTPAILVRYLDRGVDGLIVPHVESADEAQRIVDTVQSAELADPRPRYVNVLIESVLGMRNLPEILRVPGLTGVFFGPVDLCTDMGHKGNPKHPEVQALLKSAAAMVQEAGLMLGLPFGTIDSPEQYMKSGGCYAYVHAQSFMKQGAQQFVKAFKASQPADGQSSAQS